MDLSELANIVEIIGIFAIFFGLFFGAMQLKQDRIQRRDLAIIECTRLFEDEGFTEAYRLVNELPAGVSKSRVEELDEHYRSAALHIAMKFETLGMLVHRGVIPLDAMEELIGGGALATWRVLESYIKETREVSSNRMFMEWFQWLVDQMEKRDSQNRQPAFVAHANWKEPRR